MKKILIVLCSFLFLSFDNIKIERPINLNALNFEFFPCDVNDPIIKLQTASLQKFTDYEIIIYYEKVKYVWKNKTILFKENQELGCYSFLCVSCFDKYFFVFK